MSQSINFNNLSGVKFNNSIVSRVIFNGDTVYVNVIANNNMVKIGVVGETFSGPCFGANVTDINECIANLMTMKLVQAINGANIFNGQLITVDGKDDSSIRFSVNYMQYPNGNYLMPADFECCVRKLADINTVKTQTFLNNIRGYDEYINGSRDYIEGIEYDGGSILKDIFPINIDIANSLQGDMDLDWLINVSNQGGLLGYYNLSSISSSRVNFLKNSSFSGYANNGEIEILNFNSYANAVSSLNSGAIDLIQNYKDESVSTYYGNSMLRQYEDKTYCLFFNKNCELFNDDNSNYDCAKIRKALAYYFGCYEYTPPIPELTLFYSYTYKEDVLSGYPLYDPYYMQEELSSSGYNDELIRIGVFGECNIQNSIYERLYESLHWGMLQIEKVSLSKDDYIAALKSMPDNVDILLAPESFDGLALAGEVGANLLVGYSYGERYLTMLNDSYGDNGRLFMYHLAEGLWVMPMYSIKNNDICSGRIGNYLPSGLRSYDKALAKTIKY